MTKTILIVEDDVELQELYLAMMETVDCRILLAGDGDDALKQIQTVKPDLILLDIILDEMMGDELFLKLKEDPATADTPIVLLTVLPVERCQHLLEVDSGTIFLRKPFRRGTLLKMVQKALTRSPVGEAGEHEL
jgi:CheY-like chemotaxis protein